MNYTVNEFKAEFPRGFPYLSAIEWETAKQYFTGNEVYLSSNDLFYKALTNNIGQQPDLSLSDWELYEDSIYNYINDSDIEKAMKEADTVFNESLSTTEAEKELQYLYLTAHFLCLDIRAGVDGINATGKQVAQSRSVGSVSESYVVPEEWTRSSIFNFYTTTHYGLKFLSMVTPKMIGNIKSIEGATNP